MVNRINKKAQQNFFIQRHFENKMQQILTSSNDGI